MKFPEPSSFKKILEFFLLKSCLFIWWGKKQTKSSWSSCCFCWMEESSAALWVKGTKPGNFGQWDLVRRQVWLCGRGLYRPAFLQGGCSAAKLIITLDPNWGFSSPFVQVESLRDDTGCTVGCPWWPFLRQGHIGSLKPIHCSDPWTMICVATPFCKLLGHLRCGTRRRKSRPENMLIDGYIDLLALKNLQSSLKLGNHFAWTQKLKWCVLEFCLDHQFAHTVFNIDWGISPQFDDFWICTFLGLMNPEHSKLAS